MVMNHTFTATLPITIDKDGDAQLPKSFSAILKKCEHPCGAHFFGEGSPREVTAFFEDENDYFRALNAVSRLFPVNTGKENPL